ncbi:hypothetical protein [Saccharothrix obliqua]|uniref:hypothetical protein n=1 Tax=Saccharothrix obliqua TaxID=2861747 RepID=UPI001C5E8EE5|nr:hypothetical protein [Saccharothrix obliqua]MBW4715848.1 hypothetical protein [Saccharothrix obliqua]
MTPPKPLDVARWLWIASAVVGLGRFLVQLADRGTLIEVLREEQARQGITLGQDELDAGVSGGILLGLLMGGLLVLVYVALANRMARGRNWARIALTVFGVVGAVVGVTRLILVVSGLGAFYGLSVAPVDLAFGVATMLLDATAVVLMYLPSVSGYFRSQRTVAGKTPQVANGL